MIVGIDFINYTQICFFRFFPPSGFIESYATLLHQKTPNHSGSVISESFQNNFSFHWIILTLAQISSPKEKPDHCSSNVTAKKVRRDFNLRNFLGADLRQSLCSGASFQNCPMHLGLSSDQLWPVDPAEHFAGMLWEFCYYPAIFGGVVRSHEIRISMNQSGFHVMSANGFVHVDWKP